MEADQPFGNSIDETPNVRMIVDRQKFHSSETQHEEYLTILHKFAEGQTWRPRAKFLDPNWHLMNNVRGSPLRN
jgi:hypothetical protein